MVQFASRHTEIKNLDDGMAATTGNKPFSTNWQQGIYWREGVDRVAKDGDCGMGCAHVMEASDA